MFCVRGKNNYCNVFVRCLSSDSFLLFVFICTYQSDIARGVGLHFYAAFFSPCSWPTLVFSFQPHQPRLLGAIASSPPLSSPEPPPLPHPVSQLILVSLMGHIWQRLKACSRHIPLRVETTRLFLTVKSQEE